MTRVAQFLSICVFLVSGLAAGAEQHDATLDQPQGEVILTISGQIARTNGEGVARFDAAMLRSLGQETVKTSTLWTEGVQEFTGTPLAAIMEAVGVQDGKIVATAINAYSVEIPLTDAIEGGALVAYEREGEAMNIRDKGPLWVIYPYDDNPTYQSAVAYARSIWQLEKMEIVPD
ncbi:molybdopterin-dependent oxidoreductase [Poseidonocella sedimentorum]|uniref:Oxidoreductase molybdopterin-binding domain-containing protein n=1 Tax=Poseidonocella sedimentorum TaxID=871652 RepID=A0A1I6D9L1_9RHOB|nr:molybdopterin-dependent oxidoreductase [Poseidonocella sedimentorum]SFR02146.1 hypothetical protein SAMN04515673_102470 [Poseidonocella sedimentorum]